MVRDLRVAEPAGDRPFAGSAGSGPHSGEIGADIIDPRAVGR
jgi:hypothetical protein